MNKMYDHWKISVLVFAVGSIFSCLGIAMDSGGLRDPTEPFGYVAEANTKTKDLKELRLSAIFSNESDPRAVINDQVVRIGDTINKYQVVQITGLAVQLRGVHGLLTVPLLNQAVKQTIFEPTASAS